LKKINAGTAEETSIIEDMDVDVKANAQSPTKTPGKRTKSRKLAKALKEETLEEPKPKRARGEKKELCQSVSFNSVETEPLAPSDNEVISKKRVSQIKAALLSQDKETAQTKQRVPRKKRQAPVEGDESTKENARNHDEEKQMTNGNTLKYETKKIDAEAVLKKLRDTISAKSEEKNIVSDSVSPKPAMVTPSKDDDAIEKVTGYRINADVRFDVASTKHFTHLQF
jgi:hypothetical protein